MCTTQNHSALFILRDYFVFEATASSNRKIQGSIIWDCIMALETDSCSIKEVIFIKYYFVPSGKHSRHPSVKSSPSLIKFINKSCMLQQTPFKVGKLEFSASNT